MGRTRKRERQQGVLACMDARDEVRREVPPERVPTLGSSRDGRAAADRNERVAPRASMSARVCAESRRSANCTRCISAQSKAVAKSMISAKSRFVLLY